MPEYKYHCPDCSILYTELRLIEENQYFTQCSKCSVDFILDEIDEENGIAPNNSIIVQPLIDEPLIEE
jgi:hypothetical protein